MLRVRHALFALAFLLLGVGGWCTCDAGLECADGTCKLPECVAGSLNCDCYEGVCLTGLSCVDGTRKADDATPGCEAVSDRDDNLCTQGDELCEGACQAGIEVQCPLGAACDPSSGSCACEVGTKPCGNACIPAGQCCTNDECAGDSMCDGAAAPTPSARPARPSRVATAASARAPPSACGAAARAAACAAPARPTAPARASSSSAPTGALAADRHGLSPSGARRAATVVPWRA